MTDAKPQVLDQVGRMLWHKTSQTILGRDLSRPIPTVSPRMEVSISQTSPGGERWDFAAWNLASNVEQVFTERLRRGHVCFAAWAGGEFAHHCWLGFGPWTLGDIGITIELSAVEAYLYDAYTVPRFRGNGIYPAVVAVLLAFAGSQGHRVVYARANKHNMDAIGSLGRVGFGEAANLTFYRVLGGVGLSVVEADMTWDAPGGSLISRSTRTRPGIFVWRFRRVMV